MHTYTLYFYDFLFIFLFLFKHVSFSSVSCFVSLFFFWFSDFQTFLAWGLRRGVSRCRAALPCATDKKTQLPGNEREVWVPKGKLLAGPIATLLKQDTSISPLRTITHITRKFWINELRYTMSCRAILCRAMLWHTGLYCAIITFLECTVPFCTVLYRTVLY